MRRAISTPERRKTQSRVRQALYRERHAENLRLARRVVTALMKLRTRDGLTYTAFYCRGVAEALKAFLTKAEVVKLIKELRKSNLMVL